MEKAKGKNEFGSLLRAARQRAGLSLRELAKRVGVNHSHLSRLEHGKAEASRELVFRLAEVLAAPSLYIAAGYVPRQTRMEQTNGKTLFQGVLFPSYLKSEEDVPEDPMLRYLPFAKDAEGMADCMYRSIQDFYFWERKANLNTPWFLLVPPLRREVFSFYPRIYSRIEGEEKVVQSCRESFAEGVKRATQVLAELLSDHPDGMFWVFAALSVPPERARVLADVCEALMNVECNPLAAEAVIGVLRAWHQYWQKEREEEDNLGLNGGDGSRGAESKNNSEAGS